MYKRNFVGKDDTIHEIVFKSEDDKKGERVQVIFYENGFPVETLEVVKELIHDAKGNCQSIGVWKRVG